MINMALTQVQQSGKLPASATMPFKLSAKNVSSPADKKVDSSVTNNAVSGNSKRNNKVTMPKQDSGDAGGSGGAGGGNGGGALKVVKLPENLESVPKAEHFPTQRHRWNTNEEIASMLICFERHEDWLFKEVKIRPKSGSMLLYSRKKVRYRRDGYCWKKRKDGKTTREDHMKLKVQGTECIYGCYVHSAILPTFHRRCYWLLQNPDIVLVHYLNVPYSDDNKMVIAPSLSFYGDKKEWTKDELISQLKPMFFSENEPDLNNELEISQTAETVEAIVQQLMEKQRTRLPAKPHECVGPESKVNSRGGQNDKKCHTLHRIISPKSGMATMQSTAYTHQAHHTISKSNARQSSVSVAADSRSGELSRRNSNSNLSLSQQNRSEGDSSSNSTPLILNLSHLQGGGGLLILNSTPTSSGNATTSSGNGTGDSITGRPLTLSSFVCSQQVSDSDRRGLKKETLSLSEAAISSPSTSPSSSNKMDSMVSTPQSSLGGMSSHYDGMISIDDSLKMESADGGVNSASSHYTVLCDELKHDMFDHDILDLSQDDIQKTLSANLPSCSISRTSSKSLRRLEMDPSDLNPMDFIDNDISTPDDDVFANLDAFDMLTDFPDLDTLNAADAITSSSPSLSSSSILHSGLGLGLSGLTSLTNPNSCGGRTGVQSGPLASRMDHREGTANITDFSPEWSYPDGGIKVLVTGPWYSTSSPYNILFDGVSVPTTLVQSGVLRCCCPAHEVGLVTLQVACEGFVISNSVIFEYKERPGAVQSPRIEEWLTMDETLFKFTLMERLEQMESKMIMKSSRRELRSCKSECTKEARQGGSFEDRLVSLCQHMTSAIWLFDDVAPLPFNDNKGMTLIHLAAALGYAKLACSLLYWMAENPSRTLLSEVDVLSRDANNCTPLMWACAMGHKETAKLLYKWNHIAIDVKDNRGRSPLDVARVRGNGDLVAELESEEQERAHNLPEVNRSHSGSKLNLELFPLSVKTETSDREGHSPASSSASVPSPSASKTFRQGTLSKRSSVDSGINVLLGEPSKRSSLDAASFVTSPRLSRQDRSLSLPLSSGASPLSDKVVIGSEIKEERVVSPVILMDTSENVHPNGSPYIDVVGVSDEESDNHNRLDNRQSVSRNDLRRESFSSCDLNICSVGEQDTRVLTLAEQIIAALPDRIKDSTSLDDLMDQSDSIANINQLNSNVDDFSDISAAQSSFGRDEFNFEFSDNNYRYYEVATPTSSLSPASSSCLQSPCSFTLDSPSPPPTTADFCEFFQASGKIMEKDFSNLTLSDKEQRELYEAAKTIQKAYRHYKGRKRQEEQDKERAAAIVIQNYYRRYKQYAFFKQMTKAATVIQTHFRNYCEHKRFKKNQEAAVCIQHYYRNYKEQQDRIRQSREGTPTTGSGIRRTHSQRRQHQAARKIQQFMRQSKNKLQKERALAVEKEKQTLQHFSKGGINLTNA
ncbi:hypothetical protein CHUAL_009151 [Chamberlinius hualienensis]